MELWLLPSALILLKFLFKLAVDRQPDVPDLINGLLALPLDIAFLASSLLAGLIMINPEHIQLGLGLFAGTLIVGVVAALLWRRSERCFDRDRFVTMVGLFLLNLALALSTVGYVVHRLAEGSIA